jgi:hypothetical protein
LTSSAPADADRGREASVRGNGLVDAIRTAGLFNIIGRKADSPTRCRERALARTAERMLPWGDELSSLTRPADDRVLEDAD